MSNPSLFTKKDLVLIHAEDSVATAAQRMSAHDLGALLVVGHDGGRLIGIFSERDLLKRVVAQHLDPAKTRVGEVATRDPITVTAGTDLAECFQIIKSHNFRHLPLVDREGRPVGILSARDFLRHMVLGIEERTDLTVLFQQIGDFRIDIYGP